MTMKTCHSNLGHFQGSNSRVSILRKYKNWSNLYLDCSINHFG